MLNLPKFPKTMHVYSRLVFNREPDMATTLHRPAHLLSGC